MTEPSLEEGTRVSGTVVRVTDYGAWVRVDDVAAEGLVLLPEIRWGRVAIVSDHLAVGNRVDAVVLRHDPEGGRLSLSMKQLLADPWEVAAVEHAVGRVVTGVVECVTDYGLFVSIFPDIEGLLRVNLPSRSGWLERHPLANWCVGQEITVQIDAVDPVSRRVSLSPT